MKKFLLVTLCLIIVSVSFFGCAQKQAPAAAAAPAASPVSSNEEYVFMMAQAGLEYWNQHINAMYDATSDLGVKYSIVGVRGTDANDICDAMETVIARKPAGVIIAGWYPDAMTPIIDRAWNAGVPFATTTIDVPNSKRLVFLGTNYYNYGRMLMDAAAEACGGRGKVIIAAQLKAGNQAQMDGYNGQLDCLKEKYPGMTVAATVESGADAEICAQSIASALQTHPDTAVLIGQDAVFGSASVTALREVGLLGKIKIVAVDRDAPTLEGIRDGHIYAALAGKQYAEVYYAVKFLYDYNHNKVPLVADNKAYGILAQPLVCDPGAIVINAKNIKAIMEYDINKIKDPNYR